LRHKEYSEDQTKLFSKKSKRRKKLDDDTISYFDDKVGTDRILAGGSSSLNRATIKAIDNDDYEPLKKAHKRSGALTGAGLGALLASPWVADAAIKASEGKAVPAAIGAAGVAAGVGASSYLGYKLGKKIGENESEEIAKSKKFDRRGLQRYSDILKSIEDEDYKKHLHKYYK